MTLYTIALHFWSLVLLVGLVVPFASWVAGKVVSFRHDDGPDSHPSLPSLPSIPSCP